MPAKAGIQTPDRVGGRFWIPALVRLALTILTRSTSLRVMVSKVESMSESRRIAGMTDNSEVLIKEVKTQKDLSGVL